MKRILDLAAAGIGIVCTVPLGAMIAVAIKVDSKGPVFFRQVRVGFGGRHFEIIKFRTMTIGSELGSLAVNEADPRITRVGRWLRSFSVDELPQLLNVLRGDMSVVGPRPLLPQQVENFSDHEKSRMAMPPGMTNLPAIKGRNSLTWEERMSLDRWYVENWSLLLDLEILIKTPWYVIRRTGVYADDVGE